MGTNSYIEHHRKMMENLNRDRTSIAKKCYKLNKDTGLFQHCIRTVFSDEICDPPTCSCFINPISKWRNGDCPMADSFLKKSYVESKQKVKVGHQKQKHRNR